jgi:hypothetical protein
VSSNFAVKVVIGVELLAVYVKLGAAPQIKEEIVLTGLTTTLVRVTTLFDVFSLAWIVIVLAVVSVTALKVATPFEAVTVVVPPRVPKPLVIEAVTVVELLPLMTFPYASSNFAVKVVITEELLAV